MLEMITSLFETIGRSAAPDAPKSVGFGSLAIPGARPIIDRLIDYALAGNVLVTPLGKLTVETALPRGGVTPRLLLTGTVDGSPWSYAPPIPAALIDFAAGRPAVFGSITLEGVLELPRISFPADKILVTFPQPIKLWRSDQPNRGFLRRKLDSFLTTTLTGITLDRDGGDLQLTGPADWLAPHLTWGD